MAEEKTLKQVIDGSEEYLRKKVKFFNKKKKNSTNDIWLAYVDARALEDYLDDHIGPDKWQTRYSEVRGSIFCELGIFWNDVWIWKGSNGSDSNIDAEKGAASDAFKRACFRWGFGRFLYDDERKPRKGKTYYKPVAKAADTSKDEIVEEVDPDAALKEPIIKKIMEYQTSSSEEFGQMLNYIDSLGHKNLDECSLSLLGNIQKKFQLNATEREKNLTSGFDPAPQV